jgi:tetratricopeptide (TPR) repeat protein
MLTSMAGSALKNRVDRLVRTVPRIVAGVAILGQIVVGSNSQPSGAALHQRLDEYRSRKFRPDPHASDWPFDTEAERTALNLVPAGPADPHAAAFLLEYAAAAYRAGRNSAYDILQQALSVAQREPNGSEVDRAWHLAALALTQARGGGIDLGSVQTANRQQRPIDLHVYPGDARSAEAMLDALASRVTKGEAELARGVLREQVARYRGALMIRTLEHTVSGLSESRSGRPLPARIDVSPRRVRELNISHERAILNEAIRHFASAERDPAVRPEALLRHAAMLAFLAEHRNVFLDGDHPEIASMFDEVVRLTPEPRLQFLSFMFAGRYLQTQGDVAQAAERFAKASAIRPDAWSARLASANVRYLAGGLPNDVLALNDSADRRDDPWTLYPYGTYAQWGELIERLRVAADMAVAASAKRAEVR